MQKTVSAVLVLVSAVLLSTVSMFGQVTQSIPGGAGTAPKAVSEQDIQMLREDIRTQRKQITAANMTLTSTKPPSSGRFMTSTSKKPSKSTMTAGR